MSKPRKRADHARISMSVNSAHFEATGTSAEVSAKLKAWLDQVFRPLTTVRSLAAGKIIVAEEQTGGD